jgi:hypothetical protein
VTVALRNPIARNSLTTASTPHSASESNSPLSGFQCNSSEFAGARRTMPSTEWSAARCAAAKAEPIRPEEPRYRDDRLGHSLEAS